MSRPRSASEFVARYGPWAVVAGASEGLGAAFAGALARRGCKLLLLARRAEALEQVAAPLRASTEVRTAVVDLGDAELAATLTGLTAGLEVGLCVYNAAFSQIGPFLEQTLSDQLRTIDVNSNGQMSLIEYLTWKYKKSINAVQTAPQGDNAAAIAAAQAKMEQVTKALDEVLASIAKLKAEREELAKNKAELEAG